MNLNILWFILIATLFCVYFFLDGMDFGVGMLISSLGKKEEDNHKMITAIGPTWGANEVWLLTAGGAMFAAFPGWYATMFSGFYPALFLLLMALILRGIGIEFGHKASTPFAKKALNLGISISSLLIPLLLIVAIACLLRGVPIDENKEFTGTLLSLFSPYTLLAGVTGIAYFLYHGIVILKLKLSKELEHSKKIGDITGMATIILLLVTAISSAFETNVFKKPVSMICMIIAFLLILLSYVMYRRKAYKLALVLNGLFTVTTIITVFSAMFPNVMVSSTQEDYNLTIYNIASGHYTLSVMTVLTLTLLPIVIGYTIWSYWLFSKKMDDSVEY